MTTIIELRNIHRGLSTGDRSGAASVPVPGSVYRMRCNLRVRGVATVRCLSVGLEFAEVELLATVHQQEDDWSTPRESGSREFPRLAIHSFFEVEASGISAGG